MPGKVLSVCVIGVIPCTVAATGRSGDKEKSKQDSFN